MVSLVDDDPVRARGAGTALQKEGQESGKISWTFSHG
jgi:hypothetical protein